METVVVEVVIVVEEVEALETKVGAFAEVGEEEALVVDVVQGPHRCTRKVDPTRVKKRRSLTMHLASANLVVAFLPQAPKLQRSRMSSRRTCLRACRI